MDRSLPILFFNLTGEMFYILDHRLRSQNIEAGKAAKVLSDMTTLVTGSRFVDNLLKRQPLHSPPSVRNMFERLACGSIISMGRESMDKLFDLMTMVFKYQIEMCSEPADIIIITDNHFQEMAALAPTLQLSAMLHSVRHRLSEVYLRLEIFELQEIRYSLMNFLQDSRVCVSILMREKLQNADGTFPVQSIDMSSLGRIQYYDDRGEIITTANYPVTAIVMPSLSKNQPQADESYSSARLGHNIYLWFCVQSASTRDLTCSLSSASDISERKRNAEQCERTVQYKCQEDHSTVFHGDSNIMLRRLIGQQQPTPCTQHVISFQINSHGARFSRPSDDTTMDTRLDSAMYASHVDPRLNQLMNNLTFSETELSEAEYGLLDWLPDNVK